MVEDDRRARHRASEVGELRILVVVVPGVVREAAFPKPPHPGAERLVGIETHRCPAGDHQHLGVQSVRPGVANSPQSSPRRIHVGVEHLVEMVAVGEVGVGDDAADQLA